MRRLAGAGDWRRWLVLAVVTLAGLLGCQEEQRVPYIPPELHGWEQPYRGGAGLEVHAFHVGTLNPKGAAGLLGVKSPRRRELAVSAYVLKHPTQGLVVIDTGLNRRLADEAKGYLGGLLAMSVEAKLDSEQHLPAQMKAAGFDPAEVGWVVVSNLRFHHAGELESFEQATVVVSKSEHRRAFEQPSGYVRREFDDVPRWKFIDVHRDGKPLGTMPAAFDLFGDGACMLIDAPGPTDGNLAVLVRMPDRPILLAGDFAPSLESVRYAAAPASLVDRDAWWDHIWRLKRFSDLEPQLFIVPGYSADLLQREPLAGTHWHEFNSPDAEPTSERPNGRDR